MHIIMPMIVDIMHIMVRIMPISAHYYAYYCTDYAESCAY